MRGNLSLASQVERTWWHAREQEGLDAAKQIRDYRDYFAGDYRLFQAVITDRQRQYVYQLDRLGYNLCAKACQGPVNRLALTGLSARKEAEQATAEQVWEWLELSRIDALQLDLYLNAVRDGAGYLLAWWPGDQRPSFGEPERPRLVVHPAYNGESGVQAIRDPDTDQIRSYQHYWKRYEADGRISPMRSDYYPDHLETYSLEEGWQLERTDPWLDRDGNPLGLPFLEFAYPGGSKLKNLMGLQDVLNKELMDLMEWADKAIYATKYVFGVGLAYESSTGKSQEWEVGPDVVWHSDNPADAKAQVGQFDPPPSETVLAVIDHFKKIFVEVGNLSPLDFLPLGASPWSGEALATIELSFLAEIQRVQTYWGNVWEDVARLLLRLDNTFGAGAHNPWLLLNARWKDPRVKDAAFWQNLALKATQLGYSYEEVQREAGMTEAEIEQMQSEQEAGAARRFEAAQQAAVALGEPEEEPEE